MRKINLANFKSVTGGTAREINSRVVLDLIRNHQPVSRADLARRSGLQRSTVSLIVDQLVTDRWVTEGALRKSPRGRKPTSLYLNADRAANIGIDLRPGATRVVLAKLDTSFIVETAVPTEGTAAQFTAQLTAQIVALIAARPEIKFEGIGVRLPGRSDSRSHKLVFAPNLPWQNLDLKKPLERATGLPVGLENAANARALADIWCGRHADSVRSLIAVTVSEGIGTGIIVDGQLVRGATGMAGEFGHVSLDENGPRCNCGNSGCWEVPASNTAAVRYYEELTSANRGRAQQPAKILFDDLLLLAASGGARAGGALDRMAHYLGAGLAMLVSSLSPDLITVVGKVTAAWDRVGPIIHSEVKRRCPALVTPRILPTDPATEPRLRGAVALMLQKHFYVPFLF
ncbi:MAG TPA: ROK family transcriptional regulator [Verrucomicrobiae bacterium]|nr:ROK family transcriptional regulator [Verrucomicrobiae bacterium]